MDIKKRFALKARFLRFIHLTLEMFINPKQSHQAFTITSSLDFKNITIWLVETKYVACTCGKIWHKAELSIEDKMLCQKLLDELMK